MRNLLAAVLVSFTLAPLPAIAQELPEEGRTRYTYTGMMDISLLDGPSATWILSLTHQSTDLWHWALRVNTWDKFGRLENYGYGDQFFRFILISAYLLPRSPGFPVGDNGCEMAGLALEAGKSGYWSTAGCGPIAGGWYPGTDPGPDASFAGGLIEYDSRSSWEAKGHGPVEFERHGSSVLLLESIAVVPEPATIALVGTGLLGIMLARYRRRPKPAGVREN